MRERGEGAANGSQAEVVLLRREEGGAGVCGGCASGSAAAGAQQVKKEGLRRMRSGRRYAYHCWQRMALIGPAPGCCSAVRRRSANGVAFNSFGVKVEERYHWSRDPRLVAIRRAYSQFPRWKRAAEGTSSVSNASGRRGGGGVAVVGVPAGSGGHVVGRLRRIGAEAGLAASYSSTRELHRLISSFLVTHVPFDFG